MPKKLIFVAGELPKKRIPSNYEVGLVADQLEALLVHHCEDESFFALYCDTAGPTRIIDALSSRVKLVGRAASRALNYNKSRDFSIDQSAFLNFLQEHSDKATVMVICAPTYLLEEFISTWAQSVGHQPIASRTLRFGTMHMIEVESGRIQSLIA